MSASDLYLTDPGGEVDNLNRSAEVWRQLTGHAIALDSKAGRNVANFARFHVTASRDLAAALALSGLSWDEAVFRDVVQAEQNERDGPFDHLYGAAKTVSRWGAGAADAMVDEVYQKPLRMATRQLTTDESLVQSYMGAGSSPLGQATRAMAQGYKVNQGEGLFFQPQDKGLTPEVAEQFKAQMDQTRATGQPIDMQTELRRLEQMKLQTDGVDIAQKAGESYLNTQLTKTVNGQEYRVPASVGNLGALQVFTPETVPYNIMAVGTDLSILVAFDALNAVADVGTTIMKARRLAVPVDDLDVLYRDGLRKMFAKQGVAIDAPRPPQHGPGVMGSQNPRRVPDVEIYDTKSGYRGLVDQVQADPAATWSRGNAYNDAMIAEGFEKPIDLVNYLEANGGEKAFFDWVVEHELTHRAQEPLYADAVARRNAVAKQLDEFDELMTPDWVQNVERTEFEEVRAARDKAQADFYELDAAMKDIEYATEFEAEQIATRQMVGGNMRATQIRKKQELLQGMGKGWRRWVKPTATNDWAASARGKRVLNYLANEADEANVIRRLDGLPPQAQLQIVDAKTEQEVFEILKPFLGRQLEEYPRRGVGIHTAGWRQSDEMLQSEVPLDPQQGPGGGVSRLKADDPLSMEMRNVQGPSRIVGEPGADSGYLFASIDNPSQLVSNPTELADSRTYLVMRSEDAVAGVDEIPVHAEISRTQLEHLRDTGELDFNRAKWWRGNADEVLEDDWGRLVDNQGDLIDDRGLDVELAKRNTSRVIANSPDYLDDAGNWVKEYRKEGFMSRFTRRYTAKAGQGAVVLDPMDVRRTASSVQAWLDTIGAPLEVRGQILRDLLEARGSWNGTMRVADKMRDAFEVRLVEQGYNEDIVRHVMDQFSSSILTHKIYMDDVMANPIDELQNAVTVLVNPVTGEKITYRAPTAVRETQFYHRNIAVPGVRDVRVATSKLRSTVTKLGGGWLIDTGIDAAEARAMSLTWLRYKADQAMALWRNFALLRVGWPLRVLPDEMLRIMASGYADSFKNPLSYVAMVVGEKGGTDLLGGSLDDWISLKSGGLGVGDHARDVSTNLPLSASRYDAHQVSWVPVSMGEKGYNAGLSRGLIQLRGGALTRMVAEHGVDEAYELLLSGAYDDVLEEIARDAGKGNKMSKIADDPLMLRRTLESQEAQIARFTGGDFYYRKEISPGEWRWADRNGSLVNMFKDMDGRAMRDELVRRNVPGRSYARSKQQMRELLMKDEYGVNFDELEETLMYVTMDQGSPRIREWIATGTDPVRPDQVILPEENLTVTDFERFEAEVLDFYDDTYQPSPRVHAPDGTKHGRIESAGERVTERLFYGLGGLPTTKLMRHPMFVDRYMEVSSRFYLWADEATRADMLKWADDVNMRSDFNRSVAKHLEQRGLKELPGPGLSPMTLEEIDEIAKFTALDDVRNLLYDLSQSGNWADSLRLVFPFADAWWEVLTRWTHLYNPYLMGGQALRNYRKPEIAISSAQRLGWFQEDEFGNEVFNFGPATHVFGGFKMQPQVSLDQFMFIDPANPRSAISPGTSPLIQAAASTVDAVGVLPKDVQDAMNWAVFGDYQPGGIDSFGDIIRPLLPTPYKRAAQAILEDEYRTDMANEIVQATSGLCMAGGNGFDCHTREGLEAAQAEAEQIGSELSFLRILHGFALPAQPRMSAQVTMVNEAIKSENPNLWVSVAAYGQEYRAAEEMLGSREAAIQYMYGNFGRNPLMMVAGSRQLRPAPATENQYEFYTDNPTIAQHAPLTGMAFVPVWDDDPFYTPAWNEQFSGADPVREKITSAKQAGSLISWQLANNAWAQIQEQIEEAEATVKAQWEGYPATTREGLDQITNWKNYRVRDLHAQYAMFGEDGPAYVTQRPSYEVAMDELRKIAYDPTVNADLKEVDPELVGFVEFAIDAWEQAEQYSLDRLTNMNWWRMAQLTRELSPDEEDEAQKVREWFIGSLDQYIRTTGMDYSEGTGAYWITNRVFKPLMVNYDYDDEIWIGAVPMPPPPREILAADQGVAHGR